MAVDESSTSTCYRDARGRLIMLALAVVGALVVGACSSAKGDSPIDGGFTTGKCQGTAQENALVTAYRGAISNLPQLGSDAKTIEYRATCASQWPLAPGIIPPVTHLAAVEENLVISQAFTADELRAMIGPNAEGWHSAGGWDDIQGNGSAYVNYCAKVENMWSMLAVYRGPLVNGKGPLQIVVDGYPDAWDCPTKPSDG